MFLLPATLPHITTARLLLRDMRVTDVGDLFAIYGNPEVMRFASDPPFAQPSAIEPMLRSVQNQLLAGVSLEWGILLRDCGRLIGTCGLHSPQAASPSHAAAAEIGCLLARNAWGRGYMREALAAVIDFASGQLGLGCFLADIDLPNTRSIALFQSLGFRHEADTIYVLNLPGPHP